MKRIIIHWTAGTNVPNSEDLKHYHFTIDKNGRVNSGIYKPSDNENCNDGKYAAHTGGGNTGSYGISICGMMHFSSENDLGIYPIKPLQTEACFKKVAEICKQNKFPVSIATVLTHAEFGQLHPQSESYGKIDFIWLPYDFDNERKTAKQTEIYKRMYSVKKSFLKRELTESEINLLVNISACGNFIRDKINWYLNHI